MIIFVKIVVRTRTTVSITQTVVWFQAFFSYFTNFFSKDYEAHFTWLPPHSTAVKPRRSGPVRTCGAISWGWSAAFHAMKTLIKVSGAGSIWSSAPFYAITFPDGHMSESINNRKHAQIVTTNHFMIFLAIYFFIVAAPPYKCRIMRKTCLKRSGFSEPVSPLNRL